MKLLILSILLSIGCVSQSLAQNYHQIDSLYSVLESASEDARWSIYNELGWAYRMSYPDSTHYFSSLVLKSEASSAMKAEALNFQGIAYTYKEEYADAFESYRQALDIATQGKDSTQMAHAYNNLGRLFLSQGGRVKAFDYVNQALDIFEEKQDKECIGYCYKSLVQLYELQNDTNRVINLLQKTLQIRKEVADIHGQISVYQELAAFHKKGATLNEAHEYLKLAMTLSESIQDQISIAETNHALAELWYYQSDYSQSMKHLRHAMVAAGVSNNTKIISSINLSLAKNYFAQSQYRKASLYLLDVIDTTTGEVTLHQQVEAFYYLAKVYEGLEQYPTALNFYQKYVAAKDSLHNIDRAITVERLENRLKMEGREKEYELLKAQEAQSREVLERARVKNLAKNIILLLGVLFLVTLITIYARVCQKNRLLQRQKNQIEDQNHKIVSQNLQITQQNHELSEQNQRLEEIDQERETLLSIVTHDLKAPFQRINGLAEILSMNLTADEKESHRYLDLIKYTSQDGSSLVNNLLNTSVIEKNQVLNLEEITLQPFLTKIIENFERQAAAKFMQLNLEVEPNLSFQSEPLYLSQILNNLVSNAIKYAPANTQIYIEAKSLATDQIQISVRDEGPGFSEEDKKSLYQKFKRLSARPTNGESSHGLGLSIVKVLSERIQSTIKLISEQGEGSKFILTCPSTLDLSVTTNRNVDTNR